MYYVYWYIAQSIGQILLAFFTHALVYEDNQGMYHKSEEFLIWLDLQFTDMGG